MNAAHEQKKNESKLWNAMNVFKSFFKAETACEIEVDYQKRIAEKEKALCDVIEQLNKLASSQDTIHHTFICDTSRSMSEKSYNLMMAAIKIQLDILRSKSDH